MIKKSLILNINFFSENISNLHKGVKVKPYIFFSSLCKPNNGKKDFFFLHFLPFFFLFFLDPNTQRKYFSLPSPSTTKQSVRDLGEKGKWSKKKKISYACLDVERKRKEKWFFTCLVCKIIKERVLSHIVQVSLDCAIYKLWTILISQGIFWNWVKLIGL